MAALLLVSPFLGCRTTAAKRLWTERWQIVGMPVLTSSGFFLLDEGRPGLRAVRVEDAAPMWLAENRLFGAHDDSGTLSTADGATIVVVSDGELSALKAATGEELWAATLMKTPQQGEDFDRDTALIVNDVLLLTGMDLRAMAVRLSDGKKLWRTPHGVDNSDVKVLRVFGATIVTLSAKDLVAHDLATGARRWSVPLPGDYDDGGIRAEHSFRGLPDAPPGSILPIVAPDRVVGIDLGSGQIKYAIGTVARASCSVSPGVLLIADGFGLRGFDPQSGAELWKQPRPGPKWVTSLERDHALLQLEREICAVDFRDGKVSQCQRQLGMTEPERPRASRPGRVVLWSGHDTKAWQWQDGTLRGEKLAPPPLMTHAEPYQVVMHGERIAVEWKSGEVSMYSLK